MAIAEEQTGGVRRMMRLVTAAFGTSAGPEIEDQLAILQYRRVAELIPVLYLTVAVMALATALASAGDFPFVYQAILPVSLVITSLVRYRAWQSRKHDGISPDHARRHLRTTLVLSFVMSAAAGLWAFTAFYETYEPRRVLAAFFSTLSALAVASCLSSLPRAAIAVILLSLTPISIATLTTPDLGIQAAGMCVVVVALLQIHLVISKFRDTVNGLVLQEQIQRLADTDALTDLPNRRVFTERLEAGLARAAGQGVTVALIDLDGFKAANDCHGHAVGDEVLKQVALRLSSLCQDGALAARFGGDEFAILFSTGMAAAQVEDRLAAVRALIALPYDGSTHVTGISASIGKAECPGDGQDADALLLSADRALYADKATRAGSGASNRRPAVAG